MGVNAVAAAAMATGAGATGSKLERWRQGQQLVSIPGCQRTDSGLVPCHVICRNRNSTAEIVGRVPAAAAVTIAAAEAAAAVAMARKEQEQGYGSSSAGSSGGHNKQWWQQQDHWQLLRTSVPKVLMMSRSSSR